LIIVLDPVGAVNVISATLLLATADATFVGGLGKVLTFKLGEGSDIALLIFLTVIVNEYMLFAVRPLAVIVVEG
jgi:hypothetical protein